MSSLPTLAADPDFFRVRVEACFDAVTSVLRGHAVAVRQVLATVLARGHILLEDVPGVGKTTLARALAAVLGRSFARIQFTADMLPSDVMGVQIFDREAGTFVFRKGPLFAQVVLADEINRASPKTQSAMLEAMEEGCVTVDDRTHRLPQPFLVIATQNPVEHHGAYPLPESQLDRFAASLSLGYPGADDERALVLAPLDPAQHLAKLKPVLEDGDLARMQAAVDGVKIAGVVSEYLLSIVTASRQHADIALGCSPRGTLVFAQLARAWALMHGRSFVMPDDVKAVAELALVHRVMLSGGTSGRQAVRAVVRDLLNRLPVPR